MKWLKLLFFAAIVVNFSLAAYEPRFVVLVASYNNKLWYRRNLDSIFSQTYPHYRVIYIDDVSTDGTGDLVEDYIKEVEYKGNFTLIKNTKKRLKVSNFYKAVHSCDDHEIIIELDGDDWFFDENALSTLAKYYRNSDVWMTYGQYINENVHRKYRMGNLNSVKSTLSKKIPPKILENNSIRSYKWVTSHLRTFYAWLYKGIKLKDLLLDNDFYPVTGDLAMAFPMIEMAGEHSCFVEEVLYVYNNHSPLNDFRKRPAEQVFSEVNLRRKKAYKPLSEAHLYLANKFKNVKADLICVCKNQVDLQNLLEKLTVVDSVNSINIICSSDHSTIIEEKYLKICKVNEIDITSADAIKEAICDCLSHTNKYVVLMNDAAIIPENLDFNKAILELEKTHTYAVLLHKNKNEIALEQLILVFDDVYAWNLKYNSSVNLDDSYMVLYRSKDLYKNIVSSQLFDGNASKISSEPKFGLVLDFDKD